MSYLKLMKLMYLAEKNFILQYGERLTGDTFFCMPKGPVLSSTYELFSGGNEYWNSWISNCGNYELEFKQQDNVALDDPLSTFEALSPAVLAVLNEVFNQYGHMNRWDLVALTHGPTCPEWHDPHGSSIPISLRELLSANGKSSEETQDILNKIAEFDELQQLAAPLQ